MLTNTPTSERIHIGLFGRVNVGKSSLFNAITNQNNSIVSDIKGTTTDAVKKTMEILPLGPVIIFDTAGIDDETKLGKERYSKTIEVLNKMDIALFITDSEQMTDVENEFLNKIKEKNIPYFIVVNKSDSVNCEKIEQNKIKVSAKFNKNIDFLKEEISKLNAKKDKKIISDRLKSGDTVILVIPIDESAPKGRLILPQQLVLRELLDKNCNVIGLQPQTLNSMLQNLKTPPALVITDSQAFNTVKDIVSDNIKLTSFSILFANYKGNLKTMTEGLKSISALNNGDDILISEGCTHHRQCNDIGTVKIPKLIEKFTNKKFNFHYTQGGEFPENPSDYKLIIHCGGCMLNEKEMQQRIKNAENNNIPIVNYGILISFINGILKKSLEIFPELN